MSDYGSLYEIDSTYNAERDAYEVSIGYLEKDKDVPGRIMSVRVIVNVANKKDSKKKVLTTALRKAKKILASASKAEFDDE